MNQPFKAYFAELTREGPPSDLNIASPCCNQKLFIFDSTDRQIYPSTRNDPCGSFNTQLVEVDFSELLKMIDNISSVAQIIAIGYKSEKQHFYKDESAVEKRYYPNKCDLDILSKRIIYMTICFRASAIRTLTVTFYKFGLIKVWSCWDFDYLVEILNTMRQK